MYKQKSQQKEKFQKFHMDVDTSAESPYCLKKRQKRPKNLKGIHFLKTSLGDKLFLVKEVDLSSIIFKISNKIIMERKQENSFILILNKIPLPDGISIWLRLRMFPVA